VVTLKEPVARGDKTSTAIAHFAFPQAPHRHLKPGRVLEFFEGGSLIARIQLGEDAGFIETDA
jgi:hypothetical protein